MSEHDLWLVGQTFPVENKPDELHDHWEFQGIFSSEEAAMEAINEYETDCVFLALVELDAPLPEKTCDWPLVWYPKLEDRPDHL